MPKKLKQLIILIFIMLFIPGCSFDSFETKKLMHPPKATGEMAQIQALIEKTVGTDIIFKYPQNGDFKSAIIMHDLDGDNQEEAIAVYQIANQDTQSYIMVIDKIGDTWQVIKTITAQGTDLDKVSFGDINGDGKDDIILGWSSYTSYGKELTVILYEEGNYNILIPNETYSDILVSDFDDDGKSEILALSLSRREDTQSDNDISKAARAKLIKFNTENRCFDVMGSVLIDSTVVKYNHVKFGNISSTQKGAVIDAITDKERTMSEIVYWSKTEKALKAPLYNAQTLNSTEFLRDSVISSSDINNDSLIELPKIDLTDGSNDKFTYILSWFNYDTNSNKSTYVESTLMNDNDSYIFVIPEKWKGTEQGSYKIRFTYDYDNSTLRIFEQTEKELQESDEAEILNIVILSKKEYEDITDKKDYLVLAQENNKIYTAIIDTSSEISLSAEEIKKNFKVI